MQTIFLFAIPTTTHPLIAEKDTARPSDAVNRLRFPHNLTARNNIYKPILYVEEQPLSLKSKWNSFLYSKSEVTINTVAKLVSNYIFGDPYLCDLDIKNNTDHAYMEHRKQQVGRNCAIRVSPSDIPRICETSSLSGPQGCVREAVLIVCRILVFAASDFSVSDAALGI